MNLLNKPPLGLKPHKLTAAEKRANRDWMDRVKQLPCVICGSPPPNEAHHCIHGRYGTKRASDRDTIPLCETCHRYPHEGAIHSGKKTWAERHGHDYEYLPQVAAQLGEVDF